MPALRTFLPWIAFAVIATKGDWRYGAPAALLLALWLLAADRRAGRGAGELVMEISGAAFFAALTAFSWTVPHSPLTPYGPALAMGWLAVTAWGSLLAGRPFTTGIARTMTPPELWGDPRFRRANTVITAVWAASFTATGAALAVLLAAAPHATAAVVSVKLLGFALPAAYTVHRRRAAARRAVVGAGAGESGEAAGAGEGLPQAGPARVPAA
ncbi:hypothetical protein LO771_03365 [Streptacidiphilus sp. ASG 303]|uniref:hypothetical protein n=1 Tax=Streptacidiphilus sp. ASG 303 TaxID=2896847 RepID=UPI001E3C44A9|nr:hypothetical protein [Streptacidiphilus sp. ASG 303]MCD0481471.1 hypothetical protein [Streptacidiphilus sp. ASG 303]